MVKVRVATRINAAALAALYRRDMNASGGVSTGVVAVVVPLPLSSII